MVELTITERLHHLRSSLERIKALLAWERLKRREAQSANPRTFQIQDSTEHQIRNEYSLLIASLLNTHSILNDPSTRISKAEREQNEQQLAQIQWHLYRLKLHWRFGGPVG
jgi:hypothetical protein